MKKTIITNLCVGLFLLTACTINDNPIVGPDDHGEGAKDYVERMVPVVDPQNNPQGMVTLRFYNDMPSVAYVSISHFQSMMYPGTTVEVTQTSPDMYALTSPCGTATVDIQKDIFESDDYESFTNMMGMIQQACLIPRLMRCPYYDGNLSKHRLNRCMWRLTMAATAST